MRTPVDVGVVRCLVLVKTLLSRIRGVRRSRAAAILDFETCVAAGTTRHLRASWVVYDAWSEGQCSL